MAARWFVDRTPQTARPTLNLRRLLPGAQYAGARELQVAGCSTDSLKLDPGQLFVAVESRGTETVARAIGRGASGVVVEQSCPDLGSLQVVVSDARSALAEINHALAGTPSDQLDVVGVAGASGKSATALFVRSIFRAEGRIVGSMGPRGWYDGQAARPIRGESIDAAERSTMMSRMVARGCDSAVIEADASAIDARHLDGIAWRSVVVTSLGSDDAGASPDGLDRAERRRSFARMARRVAVGGSVVVDLDDPDADVLGAVNLQARRVTFAIDNPSSDLGATIERADAQSTRFWLRGFDRDVVVTLRIAGLAAVRQALAAASIAWAEGVSVEAVVRGLESVGRTPGRFEPVEEGQGFAVRVDQARTGEALSHALMKLREKAAGRVFCVVGADGRSRPVDRAALGRAAERGADRVILTLDNPRDADPNQIVDDMLAGFDRPARATIKFDRREAIIAALDEAGPGDGVLIAGKGARTLQIFAESTETFDDAAVARDHLRVRFGTDRASA